MDIMRVEVEKTDVVSGLEYVCICRCIDRYLSTYSRYMTRTSCRL
jgi:hypothetical protein